VSICEFTQRTLQQIELVSPQCKCRPSRSAESFLPLHDLHAEFLRIARLRHLHYYSVGEWRVTSGDVIEVPWDSVRNKHENRASRSARLVRMAPRPLSRSWATWATRAAHTWRVGPPNFDKISSNLLKLFRYQYKTFDIAKLGLDSQNICECTIEFAKLDVR